VTQLQACYQLSCKEPGQYHICVNLPFKTGSTDVINYRAAEERLCCREQFHQAAWRSPAAIWRQWLQRGSAPQRDPEPPRLDDRALPVATSGLRPSCEQILPRLTRASHHRISRIPAVDLVFLIVLPVAGGAAAAAQPACWGRSCGSQN